SPVPFAADAVISKDSMYNPLHADLVDYRVRFGDLGPRKFIDDVALGRFIAGIRGETTDFLRGWTYELSINYGETKAKYHTTGQLIRPLLRDSLGPSMLDADGTPICVRVPGDPSTRIFYTRKDALLGLKLVPCVPLNLFGGPIPADQLANLTYTG